MTTQHGPFIAKEFEHFGSDLFLKCSNWASQSGFSFLQWPAPDFPCQLADVFPPCSPEPGLTKAPQNHSFEADSFQNTTYRLIAKVLACCCLAKYLISFCWTEAKHTFNLLPTETCSALSSLESACLHSTGHEIIRLRHLAHKDWEIKWQKMLIELQSRRLAANVVLKGAFTQTVLNPAT